MRKQIPLLILVCIVTILFGTGCEEEDGILAQYAGERVGLMLETEEYSDAYFYQPQLETALINYINRRFDLQVVNPRLLMKREPTLESRLEDFCRKELGLNYLLTIDLVNIAVNEPQPSMDIWPKNFSFKVTTSCSLTLTYTFQNLNTTGIMYFGQSNGSSRQVSRVRASQHGVHFNIKEINYYDLIEDAMFDALRRTDLL